MTPLTPTPSPKIPRPEGGDRTLPEIIYPVYRPRLGGRERDLVLECLDSTWISSKGRFIGEFERRFAGFVGTRHAIAVSNGTVALHLALAALGIGPGDEVIVPTLTYIASVSTIEHVGARPVFVDSEPEGWQLDPADVRRKVTPRTKAIVAVHLYGRPCDMASLRSIADEHGLRIVEDCAEAIGTRREGRHAGTFGDFGTFSFYGNKTITTGEGGMVVTGDDGLADLARRLRGQGLAKDREYWHDLIGFNFRMTNICAAIGCAQMDGIEPTIARKRAIAGRYRRGLAGLPLEVHREAPGTSHGCWMVSVLVPDAALRDPLRRHLRLDGIETRPLFPPVHLMPMYRAIAGRHPTAEDLAARGLNLPSYPDLTDRDVDRICRSIRAFLDSVGTGS
jgi:perosamine synthetase